MTISSELGKDGLKWLADLHGEAEDSPQLLSEWEQTFMDDMYDKACEHGIKLLISEKQNAILERIAKKLGVE